MTSILQAAQHTALPARQQPVAALAAACRPTCTTPTTPALVGCGGRHLQPAHCRRCRRRLPPACAAAGSEEGLPANSSPSAVADWAAVSFKDTARTNLVKACLLIALEEEAAASAAYAEAEGVDGDALRGSVGSASTWSLERIASLAEEATVTFYAKLQDLGVADSTLAVAREVPDSTLLTLHMDLVRSYPTQLITAVNHVLYERHGYRRQRRHGDPLDMRLSNVLENGNGSPCSLTVLYQEVCARLSLPLQPVALEGGRYFVLMPADETVSLSVAGEAFVIDPYSEGMLLSVTEVKELFEVEELVPCGNEALLAGMLAGLADSHWCAAVGCPPEPIFAVPISVEVALGRYRDVEVETSSGEDSEGGYFTVRFTEPGEAGMEESQGQRWWPARGYHLERALAASRKRAWLLPGDLHAQLEHALLLFFDQQYEDAWTELGCVLQAAKAELAGGAPAPAFEPEEVEQLEALFNKVQLQLTFAAS